MASSVVPLPRSWKQQALNRTAMPMTSRLRLIIWLLPVKPYGSTVRPRRLYSAPGPSRRPIQLACDDVDQFAGHDDHFADRQAIDEAQHVFIGPCGGFDFFASGGGRH